MKLKICLAAALAAAITFAPSSVPVRAQTTSTATLLPPGKQCFQATAGINGMVGTLGTLSGGSAYVVGTYGGVALTGGSGTGATANITVAGGAVTTVTILNPGVQYVIGDVLSASAASIGGAGSGFSVPVASTSINSSLAGGSVAYYIPSTLTTKQTWQNAAASVLNQNPVPLDANGCAIVYGSGSYRQILKDSLSNTVWDVVTASTGGGGGSSGMVALGDNAYVGDIHAFSGIVAPTNYMFAAGQAISRTTYAALLGVITDSMTITCSSGSPTIGGLSDTTQIPIGAPLEASCFAPGATVVAKTVSSVTMSSNATASSAVTGVFFPWGDGDRATTFNLPNLSGIVLAGRDNLSGSNAGKLTFQYYGSNPDALGAAGGAQNTTLGPAQMSAYTPAGTISNGAITSTVSGGTVGGTSTGTATGATSGSVFPDNPATVTVTSTQAASTFTGTPSSGGIAASAVVTGVGSGYTTGTQTLTISGGTCSIQPQFNVTVSSGTISSPVLLTAGYCTTAPSNPAATTGGGGSGGTLTVTYSTTPVPIIQPTITINYVIKVQSDTISAGIVGLTATLPIVVSVSSPGVENVAMNPSGITPASYGSGANVPVLTFSTFGIATGASTTPVTPAMSNVTGVNTYINGLGADVSPDGVNDYLMMRRASDGAMVKVNPTSIAGTNTAGVSSVGGVAGALGLGTGLSMVGSTITPAANVSNINGQTGALTCSTGLVCGGSVLRATPTQFFNVYEYGARTDYHEDSTLSANSGSPNAVSATDHPFNVNMVGDLIAINGMGSGANYFGTIASFIDDNHITVTPGIVTTQSNQFGQFCVDQTASIQAAIDAAKTAGGGTVQFPSVGTYCVTQLNATQAVCCNLSLVIQGAAAVAGSRLMPMRNVNAVLDVTGTSPFNMYNISMGLDHQLATPTVGLLIAPTVGNPGIDFYNLNNSFLTGRYTKATFYLDRAASSTCRKVSFINYFQGGGAGYAMVATNNNAYGVTSAFQTTLTGVESVSDWNFTGCEWHTIDSGGGVSLFSAMYLDSTANFQFFGGNAASSNPSVITIAGTTLNLLFQGTTFYSDVGPSPQHVFGGAGNLNRTGLYFTNNIITNTVNATSGTTTSLVQVP